MYNFVFSRTLSVNLPEANNDADDFTEQNLENGTGNQTQTAQVKTPNTHTS